MLFILQNLGIKHYVQLIKQQTSRTLWPSRQPPATLMTQFPHQTVSPQAALAGHPETPEATHCKDLHRLLQRQTFSCLKHCRVATLYSTD